MAVLREWQGAPIEELRRAWRVPVLHAVEHCASTNDLARSLANDGALHGTTVIADHQSAGRGRHGRAWADRPGASLLLSMVLRPSAAAPAEYASAAPAEYASAAPAESATSGAASPSTLPLRVGLACARALRAGSGLVVGIEWPNDLVVGDAKLGGVLCESTLAGGRIDFVIAGVGINVAALPEELDPATRARATSLARALVANAVGGAPPDRAQLGREIAQRLVRVRPESPLTDRELDELRRLDSLAGRRVRLAEEREGIARGILPDGALVVDTAEERVEVRAGSVRPIASRRTDSAARFIRAAPATIFAAFLDRDALLAWLPPNGMTGQIHAFDARVGGSYRMTLTYTGQDHVPGKSSADSDAVRVRFLEIVPDERIVQRIEFQSDDPAFAGGMVMTWTLTPVAGGTEVRVVCDGVPATIRPEDHAAGFEASLRQLAAFTE